MASAIQWERISCYGSNSLSLRAAISPNGFCAVSGASIQVNLTTMRLLLCWTRIVSPSPTEITVA